MKPNSRLRFQSPQWLYRYESIEEIEKWIEDSLPFTLEHMPRDNFPDAPFADPRNLTDTVFNLGTDLHTFDWDRGFYTVQRLVGQQILTLFINVVCVDSDPHISINTTPHYPHQTRPELRLTVGLSTVETSEIRCPICIELVPKRGKIVCRCGATYHNRCSQSIVTCAMLGCDYLMP